MPENNQKYMRIYWQGYKKCHKRIYGCVTLNEYAEVRKNADDNDRSVWKQVWLESCAYRQQEYLPPQEILDELINLKVQARKIGNNINQLTHLSNRFKKVMAEREVLDQLKALEQGVERAVKKMHPR